MNLLYPSDREGFCPEREPVQQSVQRLEQQREPVGKQQSQREQRLPERKRWSERSISERKDRTWERSIWERTDRISERKDRISERKDRSNGRQTGQQTDRRKDGTGSTFAEPGNWLPERISERRVRSISGRSCRKPEQPERISGRRDRTD